jgi:hypothetical protein
MSARGTYAPSSAVLYFSFCVTRFTSISRQMVLTAPVGIEGRSAMLNIRAWTVVAALGIASILAIILASKLQSEAPEQIARGSAVDAGQHDTIKTGPIHGSDASKSTYGLDPARITDW